MIFLKKTATSGNQFHKTHKSDQLSWQTAVAGPILAEQVCRKWPSSPSFSSSFVQARDHEERYFCLMSYSFLGCKVDCNAHDAAALVVRHPNSLSCKTSSLRYCINSFKPPFVVGSLPQLRSSKCATPSSPQCLPRTSISPELKNHDAVAPY